MALEFVESPYGKVRSADSPREVSEIEGFLAGWPPPLELPWFFNAPWSAVHCRLPSRHIGPDGTLIAGRPPFCCGFEPSMSRSSTARSRLSCPQRGIVENSSGSSRLAPGVQHFAYPLPARGPRHVTSFVGRRHAVLELYFRGREVPAPPSCSSQVHAGGRRTLTLRSGVVGLTRLGDRPPFRAYARAVLASIAILPAARLAAPIASNLTPSRATLPCPRR